MLTMKSELIHLVNSEETNEDKEETLYFYLRKIFEKLKEF
jgi:hypothetical protein